MRLTMEPETRASVRFYGFGLCLVQADEDEWFSLGLRLRFLSGLVYKLASVEGLGFRVGYKPQSTK